MEATQVDSESAVPGRRRPEFLGGLALRPKKPELRRGFFFKTLASSDGDRSWAEGPDKDELADGLNMLRLFLRSFFPRLSAMTEGKGRAENLGRRKREGQRGKGKNNYEEKDYKQRGS